MAFRQRGDVDAGARPIVLPSMVSTNYPPVPHRSERKSGPTMYAQVLEHDRISAFVPECDEFRVQQIEASWLARDVR